MKSPYRPVSCALHSALEAAATLYAVLQLEAGEQLTLRLDRLLALTHRPG